MLVLKPNRMECFQLIITIFGSALGFALGEQMVFCVVCPYSMLCWEETPALYRPKVRVGVPTASVFLYVAHRNLLHYKALDV